MERFGRNDPRVAAFTRALWDALVPEMGECVSVQGELVRATGRLRNEHFRNGLCNYYEPDEPDHGFVDAYYPRLLLFIARFVGENANAANDVETVDFFFDLPELVRRDWAAHEEGDDDGLLDWEELFDRIDVAVANWCRANPVLVDPNGRPVTERGITDLRHVFETPPCPICKARWPMCSCRTTNVLH